jgi:hypothetical protein
MADGTQSGAGSSTTVIAIAALLAAGAAGGVYWFHDQAQKAEQNLVRSKDDYRQMSQVMKKPVEEYLRRIKLQPGIVKDDGGDLLTFLDRKARETGVPPGSLVISKNANATVGNWVESSYTATLQGTKDAPVKKNPVVDFIGLDERQRPSTKTKSIQVTYAGEDFRQAVITFAHFQPKP